MGQATVGVDTQVVPAASQRRERWRNGAGWTREIFAARDDGDPSSSWCWRLSIAEIDADAAFSSFPGVDRELVLLSGNGLRLCFAGGETVELLRPHDSLRFPGERALTGALVDGPTTDFNLMWRRDAVEASLWRRPLVGAMVLFVDPGDTWAVHVLAGHATFDARCGLPALAAGDTALLGASGRRERFPLVGGGEALMMRISPLASPGASDAAGPGPAPSR
ncbi:MAG TPA: HutD family protein [Xanthomonadaceae bacterium]|nr:HutD family protein [Xanthomonadaceae bacterium]